MDRQEKIDLAREERYREQAKMLAAEPGGGRLADPPSPSYTQTAATPQHPRDILLSDLNDQEQRLLDKMAALRELRKELLFIGRDEGERILKIARLQQRAQGI